MGESNIKPEYLKKAEQIRHDFGASDAVRDAGLTRPQNVSWENDVSYGYMGNGI